MPNFDNLAKSILFWYVIQTNLFWQYYIFCDILKYLFDICIKYQQGMFCKVYKAENILIEILHFTIYAFVCIDETRLSERYRISVWTLFSYNYTKAISKIKLLSLRTMWQIRQDKEKRRLNGFRQMMNELHPD